MSESSVKTSCSWCGTMNPRTVEFCSACGHYAHRPRMNCDCQRCLRGREEARNSLLALEGLRLVKVRPEDLCLSAIKPIEERENATMVRSYRDEFGCWYEMRPRKGGDS